MTASVKQRLAAVAIVAAALLVTGLRAGRPDPRPPPPVSRPAPSQPAAAGLLFGDRLDLNRATAWDLESLPGIGPARAALIVEAREARGGRFTSLDELLDIPGIGPKTLARLRPKVNVGSP